MRSRRPIFPTYSNYQVWRVILRYGAERPPKPVVVGSSPTARAIFSNDLAGGTSTHSL